MGLQVGLGSRNETIADPGASCPNIRSVVMRRSRSSASRKSLYAAIAGATPWIMSGCTVNDNVGFWEQPGGMALQLLLLVAGIGLTFILIGAIGSAFD
jgi:hypothetical protein